jgi:hypothetical protein
LIDTGNGSDGAQAPPELIQPFISNVCISTNRLMLIAGSNRLLQRRCTCLYEDIAAGKSQTFPSSIPSLMIGLWPTISDIYCIGISLKILKPLILM